jgi:tripartite-type tricarboxylate transporter receptor subunit TctC
MELRRMSDLFRRGLFALLAFGLPFGLSALPANAQAPADFYKGQTVTIILSSAPGGGYDAVARTLAMYLPKHIPGAPQVVVKNMAGAGGIVAANFLYNVAPKDGLTIGGLQNNVPFEPLFGTKEANFDPTKFNWLGTPSMETAILTVSGTTPVDTWQQAKTTELTMGSSGNNSTPSFYGRLFNEVLGTKLKIIVGYESQTHAFLAMERDEINGYPSVFYNSLMATKPTWLKEGKVKLLVQLGFKEPAIANVPSVSDLVTKEDDKLLVEAAAAPLTAGRPYLMPPGVPADRVAIMRKAFADTFKDPDFIADADKRGLGVNAPRDGQALQELIVNVYTKTPPPLVERLRKLQTG